MMFVMASAFLYLGIQIFRGKTDLIHDYHQTTVTDKLAYGQAFGKAMGILAGAMALSGLVSLLGEGTMQIAVAVLAIGLIAGIVAIVRVQKKYNGGVF